MVSEVDSATDLFAWTGKWAKALGIPHEAHYLCESTSLIAKKEATAPSAPSLFLHFANQQTKGRGRGEHTWSSPPAGTGLLATWIMSPVEPPQHLTAPLFGLHVYRALTSVWPDLPWSLKAPNDIFLGERKVGGLLIEVIASGTRQTLLIGLGLNVLAVPDHLTPPPTSIAAHLNRSLTQDEWFNFLSQLQKEFEQGLKDCSMTRLSPELSESLTVALRRNPLYADLKSVSPDGDLIFTDHTVGWQTL